jgi:hypothetical protein
MGFILDVLVSTIKGDWIARCGKEAEILRRHRGEIGGSAKPMSPIETAVYGRNIHAPRSALP